MTGFDDIAWYIENSFGLIVPHTGQDGHYTPNDIATFLMNISSDSVPRVNKTCNFSVAYPPFGPYVTTLKVDDKSFFDRSGSFTVGIHGDIN